MTKHIIIPFPSTYTSLKACEVGLDVEGKKGEEFELYSRIFLKSPLKWSSSTLMW